MITIGRLHQKLFFRWRFPTMDVMSAIFIWRWLITCTNLHYTTINSPRHQNKILIHNNITFYRSQTKFMRGGYDIYYEPSWGHRKMAHNVPCDRHVTTLLFFASVECNVVVAKFYFILVSWWVCSCVMKICTNYKVTLLSDRK